ncbi:hypothetical protein CEXT_128971 [Caerostris extrusa]|uniref:Uncharacterized protein n=1 Tax=Caerostris extrusa TaxID=172846 RepID=A0AAV4TRW7_CAEEX|nr:hypothetical protein CEXT_128971 [Caerostris extrusa]
MWPTSEVLPKSPSHQKWIFNFFFFEYGQNCHPEKKNEKDWKFFFYALFMFSSAFHTRHPVSSFDISSVPYLLPSQAQQALVASTTQGSSKRLLSAATLSSP